ncbi:hypothetical protein [Actinocorallia populi]|uniref:hypothetical protein n=1 Tax=Actinocorallia populi TaxID=2079200 RepID=UPI0018E4DC3A|nr:hypothetical protein [Actinocorallia populi]
MADTYPFAFAPRHRLLLRALGVRPDNSRVVVGDGFFSARFGRWELTTPLSNLASADVSGPYKAVKAIGVRLSLRDSGLTFGSALRGVCVEFRKPVRAFGPRAHEALTVTVADPEGLAEHLASVITRG